VAAKRRKRRRSSNAKRRTNSHRTHRRRNSATRVVVVAPRANRKRRRANPRRRAVNRRRYRRNPPDMRATGMKVAGVLVGVTVTKFVPTVLPANLLSSNAVRTMVSLAIAYAASEVSKRFAGPAFSEGVLYGGLAQAATVGLNAFLPVIGRQIGLSGIVGSNRFPVPNNQFAGMGRPQLSAPMMGNGASKPVLMKNGVGAIYGW